MIGALDIRKGFINKLFINKFIPTECCPENCSCIFFFFFEAPSISVVPRKTNVKSETRAQQTRPISCASIFEIASNLSAGRRGPRCGIQALRARHSGIRWTSLNCFFFFPFFACASSKDIQKSSHSLPLM